MMRPVTAVSESARPTTDPPRQPLALCVRVAVGVVLGWLAYDRCVLPRLHAPLLNWRDSVLERGWWLVSLTFAPRGEHVLMEQARHRPPDRRGGSSVLGDREWSFDVPPPARRTTKARHLREVTGQQASYGVTTRRRA